MIPNLQKLKVSFDEEEAIVWRKFHLDNLFDLRQLGTLNIEFVHTRRHEVNPLPEGFAFSLTLKKLSLERCRIPWKDMTVVGSLPNLEVLKLRREAFVGERWEPIEGEFPQLKFLLLEKLDLVYWQAENTHLPKLQHLKIRHCKGLLEIPLEIGEISTLELIEVNSSGSADESAMKILEEQRDMGNDVLQVRVYQDTLFQVWTNVVSPCDDLASGGNEASGSNEVDLRDTRRRRRSRKQREAKRDNSHRLI